MGLAASQARLLNLTRRMHDIEYKAQNLEAQKLQMANQSKAVYTEYENALNKQKVQFKQIGADGSANYVNASISTLLDAGYTIKILKGNSWIDFARYNDKTLQELSTETGEVDKDITPTAAYNNVPVGGYAKEDDGKTYVVTEVDDAGKPTKGTLLVDTKDADLAKIDVTSEEVLRNMVEAGFIVFEKPTRETDEDGNIKFEEVNIATDTNLQEVPDELQLKKAEAKYEADMRKIDAKDKKFDTDLAAMDAERNAIKTEMDTLKSVAKENVDRTFKLFG